MSTAFRIVSGGQTGVDRAALDAALALGISIGGWCPRGRLSEAGPIPRRYRLQETPSRDYRQRTEWNVRDSDGTLIINSGSLNGGTLRTVRLARERYRKPLLIMQLGVRVRPGKFRAWLKVNRVRRLNVAGPRASKRVQIYKGALRLLLQLLDCRKEVRFSINVTSDSSQSNSHPYLKNER